MLFAPKNQIATIASKKRGERNESDSFVPTFASHIQIRRYPSTSDKEIIIVFASDNADNNGRFHMTFCLSCCCA